MIYNKDLEELVFNRHLNNNANKLTIISGYIGPNPVHNLKSLPLDCKVIYGMYASASISNSLHSTLTSLDNEKNLSIYYSTTPVHSKCYIWFKDNKIIDALIGSANFSSSGLRTPYREILSEINPSSYSELQSYMSHILQNSIHCNEGTPSSTNNYSNPNINTVSNSSSKCTMSLCDKTGQVPLSSGLNWFNSNGHTTLGDAYIAIRTNYIKNYPLLFPKKQSFPLYAHKGKPQRQNDVIEVIWDDGTIMECLLEGSQPVKDLTGKYPKQLASSPNKNILGFYIRKRLGVSKDHIITLKDLQSYGRTDIELSLLKDGTYYADFSV
ncbi:NgoFVII family restriction endonuclease [Clostridium perfringens]|nr:NgoFVII family restriction endonuclease [Clostridium perfringens]